jgi:hypothetical protein
VWRTDNRQIAAWRHLLSGGALVRVSPSFSLAAIASRLGLIDFHVVACAVSFVAGAQGNAFHKTHGVLQALW